MAAVKSKEWRSGVGCKCGSDILAYSLTYENSRSFYYFKCPGCRLSGKWLDLARGYFEYRKRTS
jgi:hypothetical protein